jgi:hypothetical protein
MKIAAIDSEFRPGVDNKKYDVVCICVKTETETKEFWLEDYAKEAIYNYLNELSKDHVFSAHYCYTPDTEVLTKEGFIRWDSLSGEEELAQYDTSSGEINYATPNYFITRDYEGDLYTQKGNYLDLAVTEGHNLLQRTRTGKVIKYRVEQGIKHTHTNIHAGVFKGGLIDEDLIELAVSVQADGKICYNPNQGHVNGIEFKFRKERKYTRLISLLNFHEIPYSTRIKECEGGMWYFIRIHKFKGIERIAVKRWVNLSQYSLDTRLRLLKELPHWDGSGSWEYGKGRCYFTTIKENAEAIQEMAILSGIRACVHIQHTPAHLIKEGNEHRTIKESTCYIVRLSERIETRTDTNTLEKSYYKGKVYCANMPLGTVVTRRSGKVVIGSNCHAEVWTFLSLGFNIDHWNFVDTFVEAKLLTNDDSKKPVNRSLAHLTKIFSIFDYDVDPRKLELLRLMEDIDNEK